MRGARPYYGWVIVALSWLNQGLGYSVWYSFSLFYVALLGEYDWDRAAAAAAFSTFVLVASLAGPAVGALVDRLGPRVVLPLGAALTALGLALCAGVTQPLEFYLAFGLVAGLGLGGLGLVPNNAAVSRWFARRLGVAAGLASTGVGAGILLVLPTLQWIIDRYGWRAAYLALAVALFGALVPLNLLLQRQGPGRPGPESAGGSASPDEDGVVPSARLVAGRPTGASHAWTLRAAAGTGRFWLLFGGLGAAAFAQQLLVVHQVAYLVDAGQSPAVAASLAGLAGACAIPAKVACGWASDRFGREVAFALGTGAYILAFPVLMAAAAAGSAPLLILYAVLVGVGLGTIGPLAPAMVADLFAGPSYGAIFGAVLVSTGLGAAMGAWSAGRIFDLTGGYHAAFVLAVLAAAAGIILCWLAAPRRPARAPAGG